MDFALMSSGRYRNAPREDYVHQTYADPNESKYLRNKIASGDLRSLIERNNGLILVALSQVFFAGMNVMAKLLSVPSDPKDKPVSTFQLIFVRMSLTYVFAVAYMMYTKVPDFLLGPKEVRGLLLLRSTVGFMGLFSIYFSLQYLPLSDATVLTFLTPCFTLVLGYLFLGESFTRREALAGLVALLGVVFIARPLSFFGATDESSKGDAPGNATQTTGSPDATEAQRLSAVLVSLLGVVGAGGAYVTIRYIGKRAHALISVSMFSLVACMFSLGGLVITKQPIVLPRGQGLVYLIALGFSGFIAQFLLTLGLQREKAGRGSTAMYTQLLWALFWERVVFGTLPDFWSLCGIALILGSTLYVAITTAGNAKEPATGNATNDDLAPIGELPINNEEALLEEADDRDSLLPMTTRDINTARDSPSTEIDCGLNDRLSASTIGQARTT